MIVVKNIFYGTIGDMLLIWHVVATSKPWQGGELIVIE
jgi:hypothetical protein